MTKDQILSHIKNRNSEIEALRKLWEHVEQLNKDVGLKQSTMAEIQAKISSRIAQYELSIRDHLNNLPLEIHKAWIDNIEVNLKSTL